MTVDASIDDRADHVLGLCLNHYMEHDSLSSECSDEMLDPYLRVLVKFRRRGKVSALVSESCVTLYKYPCGLLFL